MAQLTPYTQDVIDTWRIEEAGVEDGSSPTMNLDVQGSIATRKFFCLWEHRYTVARYFTGDADTYDAGSGVIQLSRLLPQRLPGRSDFYATKVTEISGHCWDGNDPDDWHRMTRDDDGEPMSPTDEPAPTYQFTDTTMNRYTHACLTVQFEKRLLELVEDEFIESEMDRFVQFIPAKSVVEYLTVPSTTQKHISSTGSGTGHLVPVPYPVGLTETTYKFSLKWFKIPQAAYGPGTILYTRIFGDGTIDNLPFLNAVNDELFLKNTFPIGTVMLEDVEEQLDPSILDQAPFWTITFHFAVKSHGWNSQWFFPNTNEFAGAGNAAKRMFVGRGDTYYAPGSVPDLYSNFIERDLKLLFQFHV